MCDNENGICPLTRYDVGCSDPFEYYQMDVKDGEWVKFNDVIRLLEDNGIDITTLKFKEKEPEYDPFDDGWY